MKKYRIAIIDSHVIQYNAPLFKHLSKNPNLKIDVYYCSDEGVKSIYDKEFGKTIKFDIPLLEGYEYKFLKNYSFKPSISAGFFGLMNFGIISELRKNHYDAIIIYGWSHFTNILAIVFGKIFNSTIMIRGDNPLLQEHLKSTWKIAAKKIVLRSLFKFVDVALYVGYENKLFYQYYGMKDKKLIFAPHSVDNDRFYNEYLRLKDKKMILQKEMGLSENKNVILFVGKLIDKKRPFDLLEAYSKLTNKENVYLIFVGDGNLKKDLEYYVQQKNLINVHFVGFKNQTEIPIYYTIADILVLPSGGETWGLVVNEAMNFGLPIIVSNLVGCSEDLVKHGKNGFIFEVGNTEQLSNYLNILVEDEKLRKSFGEQSITIIKKYSYSEIENQLIKALEIYRNYK